MPGGPPVCRRRPHDLRGPGGAHGDPRGAAAPVLPRRLPPPGERRPVTTARAPERLAPADLGARLAAGAMLVDVRDPRVFGAGHVAGSLNVWVDGPQFAERLQWFVPPDRPLILLAATEGEVARALAALARIGLDQVVAWVAGSA